MSILTQKRATEVNPGFFDVRFFAVWKFTYYVEFRGKWTEVEEFADSFIGKKNMNFGPERPADSYGANFETWSVGEHQYFGCYDEKLALMVNGRYGIDAI